jgi:hypothetical protein
VVLDHVPKNGRKVKAIYSLTFFHFLPLFPEMKKVAKNGRKVKAIALFFYYFYYFFLRGVSTNKTIIKNK